MFAIVVEGLRRAIFDQAVVEIGRSTLNDLVLPSPEVSRYHARIVVDEGFVIMDLNSIHGTSVDGALVESRELVAGSRFEIGPFRMTLEPSVAPDADEQRLLAAITEKNDPSCRLVYADFLEERGEALRSEFLRTQEAIVDADPTSTVWKFHMRRLRELAASIEIKWRHAVARPAIEGCNLQFNARCPKDWGSLATTERADVRHCETCQKHVYYCPSVAIAHRHVEEGDRVAVDVIPWRKRGDLDPSGDDGDFMSDDKT